MCKTRRYFLMQCYALAVSPLVPAQADEKLRPDKNTLEAGDLLWPKKPESFIPYNSGSTNSSEQERIQWETERAQFITSISPPHTLYEERLLATLGDLTFDEFHAYYTTGLPPGMPVPAGSLVGVGHVAIVDREADRITVVEAMQGLGVRQIDYEQWLAGRLGEAVWHGRLRGFEKTQRGMIAQEAKRFLRKPYQFWNFLLDDEAGFYCSKLVWLSINKALGIAIDNDRNPSRTIWLSPKQILNAPNVLVLLAPDIY
jgi:permuted papain-like amidase YaeF/Yiix C92 family enzyme